MNLLRSTTTIVKKSMNRAALRRALFLILLVLTCFALSTASQAVSLASDGGDLNANASEEYNALLDLSSATGCPTGPGLGNGHRLTDNTWAMPIQLPLRRARPAGQCIGGEAVALSGDLHVSFVVGDFRDHRGVVLPQTIERADGKFLHQDASKGVHGKGQTSGFTYDVEWVKVEVESAFPLTPSDGGGGRGYMLFRIGFATKSNSHFNFRVIYKAINYRWNQNKEVTCLFWNDTEPYLFAKCP